MTKFWNFGKQLKMRQEGCQYILYVKGSKPLKSDWTSTESDMYIQDSGLKKCINNKSGMTT